MIPIPALVSGLFTGPYALIAKWGVIALVVAGAGLTGFVKGNAYGTAKLDAYIGQQAVAAVALAVKQGEVTTKIVNRYIKVRGETQVVTKTVEKEVVKYAQANPGLCLDPAWRVLHDAAAANAVPAPGLRLDGEMRAAPSATR